MPSTTRRRLLGGGALLATGAYGAYRLDRGAAAASFESWAPAPGTWPLRRYDPANTAHNPTASPPREPPTVREARSVATGARHPRFRPVVGADHLAVHGSGLAVYPRDGGEPTSVDAVDAPLAGFGPDGRLHTVRTGSDDPDPPLSLVGYGADLRESYRRSLGADTPVGLVVGAAEVYLGTESGRIEGVDPADGRRWQADGAAPALADGGLYATDASLDGTVGYAERSGLDRRLTPGPERRWSAGPTPGFPYAPAVADGRVVAGSRAFGGGVVRALDAATGEPLWEPRSLGQDVSTPAVAGGRGYAAVGTGESDAGRVVALDLATGETVWRDAVGWAPRSAAVGGDILVVVGGTREDGGRVRAYDRASGDARWTRRLPGRGPDGVALVEDRVLVTVGASLYELR